MKFLLLLYGLFLFDSTIAQTKTYDTLPNLPAHYMERYGLFKKEPVKQGGIIMLGNSITELANWKILLKDSTVTNRGISGDVTFGILHRLKEITDREPKRLFLMIGINDLSRNTPDEVIIENIFMIARKIHSVSPTTKLYVQSILPINESFVDLNEKYIGKNDHITTINAQLKTYAKKLKYTYVDLHSAFTDAEGRMEAKLTSDGLHLTPAGYYRWVDILKKEKYL